MSTSPPTASATTLTPPSLPLDAAPISAATEHPFLTAPGGHAPSRQDRLFAAHGGPAFIGRTLAAVPFSERKNKEIVRALSYGLANVVREVDYFGDIAREHGLQAEGWKERKATRDYTAEMARVGVEGRIEDALIYLDSWRYVGSLKPVNAEGGTAPAVKSLVNNWTNPEFVKFVDELAQIVNSLGIEPGTPAWIRAEAIWARVVELEEAFWPAGGEELTLRLARRYRMRR
ncbi:uncharacterized protein B0H18DRAFT_1026483 [Fomitopsis serialis]|uniref:uncharacterized protein n=1 Tax=Fomitopsis serialis TaxID=139415 RepID=UPI00200867B7|nr:uncharacterized protein B0H18DRAFT_1026483 [Neoantrodia serialis]KAH9919856.1 hypothetical protein B0H18DRAFT_1026483 [Neoantrodia serialis]